MRAALSWIQPDLELCRRQQQRTRRKIGKGVKYDRVEGSLFGEGYMGGLRKLQDAFGLAMYEHYRGTAQLAVIERDDGYVEAPDMATAYFSEYSAWPIHERRAIRWVRGRVLDIGCGAGRVALHLQQKGFDVLGIDNSPLAAKVCRLRGLKKVRVLPISDLSSKLGLFDTLIMFGNNFGLFSNFDRARRLLRRFRSFTTGDARIIAATFDPHKTDRPEHRAYQRRNLANGRMAGQVGLRIRYKRFATPYYDYLFVSKRELKRILIGTGWHVAKWIDSAGPAYIAVIERAAPTIPCSF